MRLDNDSSDAPSTTSSGSGQTTTAGAGGANDNNLSVTAGGAPMPKHIPFPDMPSGSSEVLNELIMFLFITFAAAMQFINIYRTIWWLPESYTNHSVNLYLMEPYLLVFIVLITARRLIYCLLVHALEHFCHNKQPKSYKYVMKYVFGVLLLSMLAFCIAQIYVKQSYLSFFLLVYPLVVYLLIFGFQIEPFLRTACEVEGSYFNGMPMHCCSSSPTTIRDEIDILKNDFNSRFKQVIFTSVVNAYYAGFVPCFFAQNFIYYNVLWATQHIIFIWLSGFTMCTMFCFPAKYSDILHRASLHLGQWFRLDGRHGSGVGIPPSVWSKTVAWSNGSVVRYTGELFRCSGPVTVALPGSTSHSRFFKLFHNPSIIYMVLTAVQASIVLLQILLLYFVIEWHFVLSISFLTLTNQFTFFKIMRDFLITKRVYTAEASITDKLNSAHYN